MSADALRRDESDRNEKKGTQTLPHAESRLIGWLVSYSLDSRGKAFELRAGRCLLSPRQINSQRVILIENSGLSLPHAAIHSNDRHEVFIQDVFSEHGTYVCRADSQKEFSVEGPVQLQHGDWVRFGRDLKLQVCLIDGPSD